MRTLLVAAGILAAATLAGPTSASAKDKAFGLTIAGPNGVLSIGATGPHDGAGHRHKRHRGYGHDHRDPGYRHRDHDQFDLRRARASGYCLHPGRIRRRLRHRGWWGFRVVRLTPRFAIVRSRRYGEPYRLKVDRCTGDVVRARPLYRHLGYRYW